MRRVRERVRERAFYIFAFLLLAVAIYLNFFSGNKPGVGSDSVIVKSHMANK